MDGAESSSESETDGDDQSEEEIETKVNLSYEWANKYNRGIKEICEVYKSRVRLFLQIPQKQAKQVTPIKTPEKKDEDDEYGGSTDEDEPGNKSKFVKENQMVKAYFIWSALLPFFVPLFGCPFNLIFG